MKFWPIFLFILVSCGQHNDSVDNGKCLSCHLFLGKKGDDNYVILRENTTTGKMELVADYIENIKWKKCDVFCQRKNEFILISLVEDNIKALTFPSSQEMFEYYQKNNKFINEDNFSSSASIYEFLGDRIECR